MAYLCFYFFFFSNYEFIKAKAKYNVLSVDLSNAIMRNFFGKSVIKSLIFALQYLIMVFFFLGQDFPHPVAENVKMSKYSLHFSDFSLDSRRKCLCELANTYGVGLVKSYTIAYWMVEDKLNNLFFPRIIICQ